VNKYSPKERLDMIFAGEKPDRYAASFWRHFFHMEHHAEGTAEAMIFFQQKFEWDFMKINPRADYHVEDWGLVQEWSNDEFTKHSKLKFPVEKLEDWDNIKQIPITSSVLDEHLHVVSMIRKKSDKELPVLMTLFSPLAVAGRMVSNDNMLAKHIKNNPDTILNVLEEITLTYEAYASELRNAGADGLFYATTQWGTSNLISWEEYEKFGMPYDMRVLKATGDDATNLFHVCSSNNFLKEIIKIDYPVKMYNWDSDDPTNPPLDIGLEMITDKVIVGGCDREGWLLQATPDEIKYKIDELKEKYDPSKLIIGPGCSIPPEVPFDNLQAIKDRL
jgi:uroporphyrinogen decarboxylase